MFRLEFSSLYFYKPLCFHSDLQLLLLRLKDYQNDYTGVLVIDGKVNYKNTLFFNGEEDNPAVAIPKMLNPDAKNFMGLSIEMFATQEESHGESILPVLEYILDNAKKLSKLIG